MLIGPGLACESEPVATGPDDVPVGLRVHLNGALAARVHGTTV
jgi:hypothetical protein